MGVAAFRELEHDALAALLAPAVRRDAADPARSPGPPPVVATGGGCVEHAGSRAALARAATCVWLDAPTDLLAARLAADPTPRPALSDLAAGDPVAELPAVARRRRPLYQALADLRIDAGSDPVDALARRIADALGGSCGDGVPSA